MVAAIAGQHVDIFDGHIQLVAARIFQSDAIVRAVAYRDGGQPLIASNAVIGMHEQIAGRQRRQFLQESIGALLALVRSEERRVGKTCVNTVRSLWSPYT